MNVRERVVHNWLGWHDYELVDRETSPDGSVRRVEECPVGGRRSVLVVSMDPGDETATVERFDRDEAGGDSS